MKPSMKATMLAVAMLGTGGAVEAEPVTLRVADVLTAKHYVIQYLTQPWMDEVTKATGGEVKFEFFPNEQLGKAKDMLQLTLSGVADVGYVAPSYVSDKMPLSSVAQLPGAFDTSCAGTSRFWKLAKEGILRDSEFGANGVRVLAALVQPPYQMFTSKRPTQSLKSFEGMKIRTTGGAMDITMQKIKAIPVRIAGPEILEALNRGTVDGGVFPPASVLANDWQNAVRHGTVGENFGSFVLTYVISEKRFAKLSPAVQKAMTESGEALTKKTCAQVDKDLGEAIQKLRNAGVTMARLPVAESTALRKALSAVSLEWAKDLDTKGRPGTQVLEAFGVAVR